MTEQERISELMKSAATKARRGRAEREDEQESPTVSKETSAAPLKLNNIPNRLTGAAFIESVRFGGGEVSSAYLSLSAGMPGNVDSIIPARLDHDGSATPIANGERADGLLIVRKVHDANRHTDFWNVSFVPMTNVRSCSYTL